MSVKPFAPNREGSWPWQQVAQAVPFLVSFLILGFGHELNFKSEPVRTFEITLSPNRFGPHRYNFRSEPVRSFHITLQV